jgi:hypothetical protein
MFARVPRRALSIVLCLGIACSDPEPRPRVAPVTPEAAPPTANTDEPTPGVHAVEPTPREPASPVAAPDAPPAGSALFDPRGPFPPGALGVLTIGMSFADARARVPSLIEADDHSELYLEDSGYPGVRLAAQAASDEGIPHIGRIVLDMAGARETAERVWGAPMNVRGFREECFDARWHDVSRAWMATIDCEAGSQVEYRQYVPLADLIGDGEQLGFSVRALLGADVESVRTMLGARLRPELDQPADVRTMFAYLPPTETERFDTHMQIRLAQDRVYSIHVAFPIVGDADVTRVTALLTRMFGASIAERTTPGGTLERVHPGPPCLTMRAQRESIALELGSSVPRTDETPSCGAQW